ncbi:MAG: RNA polymerase sigma factor [Polyangiaceae bacterium]
MGEAISLVQGIAVPETASSGIFAVARRALSDHAEPESLLARAAQGDRAAFREVYQRHRSDVARLVFRMLGPRADAEDVIQEVFFQVFRSLKDFRGQSKFTTWLHRVTVNVVLMHRRAAKSRPVFADEPIQDGQINAETIQPDEDAARRERVRAFSRLLDRLAEKKRIVFILHELEGMAPAEISKVVGAPVLTVRTRLFYARRELEAMLADEPSLKGVLHELNGTSGASNGADKASEITETSEANEAKAPTEKRSDAGAKRKTNPAGDEAER